MYVSKNIGYDQHKKNFKDNLSAFINEMIDGKIKFNLNFKYEKSRLKSYKMKKLKNLRFYNAISMNFFYQMIVENNFRCII